MGTDLKEFVQSRYSDLLRTAFLLAGSSHEAEDLVQTALLRVMRRWARIDDPLPYVRRTIVNLYLNGLRRRAREVVTGMLPDRPVRDGADRLAERSVLWPALRALPPRTRAVIVLRYWQDLSCQAELLPRMGGSLLSRSADAREQRESALALYSCRAPTIRGSLATVPYGGPRGQRREHAGVRASGASRG